MSAIDPGIRASGGTDELLRRGARLAAAAFYVTALIVALVLVVDEIRKGESVATFAARHGLGLGDLLALNPEIDSLSLKPGTELRIG